jgi:hypothetical protein
MHVPGWVIPAAVASDAIANQVYSISGIPSWLNAKFTSGTATSSPVTVTFSLINVSRLAAGTYTATIAFTNTTNGAGNTSRAATLTVNPKRSRGMGVP